MTNKILIFESDVAFASELRTEFANLGCEATVVDDGNAGIQLAAQDKPSLILLAIELPRMNGFSVCNKIKKDPALKDIPLIILSSESSEETFEQHKKLRTRAEDYLSKPVSFGELFQHAQRLVAFENAPAASDLVDEILVVDDELAIEELDENGAPTGGSVRPGSKRPSAAPASNRPEARFPSAPAPRQSQPPKMPSASPRGLFNPGDDEVEQFANNAFGSNLGSARAPSVRPPSMRPLSSPPIANGPPSNHPGPPEPFPPASENVIPVRAMVDESRTAEHVASLENELRQAQKEHAELAAALQSANAESEELRSRLASATKSVPPQAGANREVLDLRETLNKKERELLGLRQLVAQKDQEALDQNDRLLQVDRAKGEADERLALLEQELADLREAKARNEHDRNAAEMRERERGAIADELQSKLTSLTAELTFKEEALKNAEQDAASAKTALRSEEAARAADVASFEQKVAALRREHEVSLERALEAAALQLRAEHQSELQSIQEKHAEELGRTVEEKVSETKRTQEASMASLVASHEEELARWKNDAKDSNEKLEAARAALEQANGGHEQALAGLRAEHAAERARLENEHATALQTALEKAAAEHLERAEEARRILVSEHEATLASTVNLWTEKVRAVESASESKVTEQETAHRAALLRVGEETDAVRKEFEEKMVALENDRDSKIAAIEARSKREIEEAQAAVQEMKASIEASGAEQAQAKLEAERLAGLLTIQKAATSELEAKVSDAHAEITRLKSELEQKANREKQVSVKWDADRNSLERAKDALAVVLKQIEDVEHRPVT